MNRMQHSVLSRKYNMIFWLHFTMYFSFHWKSFTRTLHRHSRFYHLLRRWTPIFAMSFWFAVPAIGHLDFYTNIRASNSTYHSATANKSSKLNSKIGMSEKWMRLATYAVWNPLIWYRWSILIDNNHFAHIIKAWIGWHNILIWHFIFFGRTTG